MLGGGVIGQAPCDNPIHSPSVSLRRKFCSILLYIALSATSFDVPSNELLSIIKAMPRACELIRALVDKNTSRFMLV